MTHPRAPRAFGCTAMTGPDSHADGPPHPLDCHLRLPRFGARDYDPVVGRWTAKDSARFAGDGPNFYAYVLSDPANQTDATGEGIVDCARAIAEYERLKNKLDQRIRENLEAVCTDRGHDKAIEQLQNAVERARNKVIKHCGPAAIAGLGILIAYTAIQVSGVVVFAAP